MKPVAYSFFATIAFSAMTLSATAGSYDPPVVAPPVVAPASTAHDWSGFYAGLSYTIDVNGGLGSNLASVRLGYNIDNGNMVYGGELSAGRTVGLAASFAHIGVRAGYKASDNLLLIGKLGYGRTSVGTNYIVLQAGGEYAVSNRVSLTGAYESWVDPLGVFATTSQVVFGVNFGF